ncbi:dienelactone hydrolase family protein [Tabrizicola sp.]|uniref:dienelactone hydrolase family protein n=1 Tax=Tabrizicola sp. TaxID=2005166 RepID=UPI00273383FC|nr:dienelactone hydrolase family protein [Tabrizicola sp.]MDP3196950.1 dienelactone hydrolase family protein [Tabrizicola sp.]
MTRIIFLHGVGSSGAAMRPLAEALGVAGVAHVPDGPQPFDMGPGRQWFSVNGITEENRPARIAAALRTFCAMIESFGDPQQTVLIGFSQGAIMALHAVAAGLPSRAVFALSGRLAGPVPARTDWPAITLLHGDADPVIPAAHATATNAWLHAAGAAPELKVFDVLGHGVDDRVLSFLRSALATTIA